jgi:Na+/H+ antiporter NhaD/arsenite permease-like protein
VFLERLAGGHPTRMLALITVAGAFLSLFMNNIAAAALLLPAVADVARRSRTKLIPR